jgi:hypothetical protein
MIATWSSCVAFREAAVSQILAAGQALAAPPNKGGYKQRPELWQAGWASKGKAPTARSPTCGNLRLDTARMARVIRAERFRSHK